MQGNQFKLAAASLVLMGLMQAAEAATPVPYGWYLEVNGGQSRISQKYTNGTPNTNIGFGGSAFGGYKFSPFAAAEVGYTYYSTVNIDNAFGTKAATNKHYSFDLAGKAILPVGVTGLELFVKAGVARMNSNLSITNYTAVAVGGMVLDTGSHSATGVYGGAGADFAVSPNMMINVQWAQAKGTSKTGNGTLYSGGISYIF